MRFLALPILLLACAAVQGADEPSPPPAGLAPIRVRLLSLPSTARLTIRGDGLRMRGPGGDAIALEDGAATVTLAGDQVKAGSLRGPSLRFEADVVGVEAGGIERDYPEALVLTAERGGLAISNECSFERYLEGVLAGECPASFQPEALKAMAIAARSYSFRKAYLAGGEICDQVHCQVYRGAGGVRSSIREAVRATAGQCAAYDGEVIDAVYSSDCGGQTEANEAVWAGSRPLPYLRPVLDAPEGGLAYCAANRGHRWSLSLSVARLRSLLGRAAGTPRLKVLDVTPGGRVGRLRLTSSAPDDGEAASGGPGRVFTGEDWRKLLGLSAVRSLRFEPREVESGVELVGAGYGHGVGLCQYGANGLAKAGADADTIVRHYYSGVTVGPLPALAQARAVFARNRAVDLATRSRRPRRR